MKYLLPNVPFHKACLHAHSNISDGKLSPEELREEYKARGYSILAITDHSVMVEHQVLSQPDFLMLTGVEIDLDIYSDRFGKGGRRERHLCLIGKDPKKQWIPYTDPRPIPSSVPYEATNEIAGMSRLGTTENTNLVIAECNRQGFLVIYNHPTGSGDRYPDYCDLQGLWGMEYRNGDTIAHGADENNGRVYDDLLDLGHHLMPVCADDTHGIISKRNGYPTLDMNWNMVGTEKLDYDSVIAALERGDLYASCGPEITSLTLDGDTLRLTCSPADRVQMFSNTGAHVLVHGNGGTVTEAIFKVPPKTKVYRDAYLRFIVTAPDGSYAVTRAYWADDLQP